MHSYQLMWSRELHGDKEWTRSPHVPVIPKRCQPRTRSFQTSPRPYLSVSNPCPPVPVVFSPSPPITTNANCQYVVKRLQKKLLMHNTQQSSHTNCTVYSPCKNNSPSTDSADSIYLPSSMYAQQGKMIVRMVKCTVKCMGWGIPMNAHRARGVPAGCWTHPRGDPVLLAPSPRLNRELYPHTHGFPVGPAGNPLSPFPCSSLLHM